MGATASVPQPTAGARDFLAHARRPVPGRWTRAGKLVFTAVTVTVLGEVRVFPFGTAFRFSLGPAGLSLLLLLDDTLPYLGTGAATALAVLVFRAGLAIWREGMPHPWWTPLAGVGPSAGYYLLMGALFALFSARRQAQRPIVLAVSLFVADVVPNIVEMWLRGQFPGLAELEALGVVGLGRAVLAAGIYYIYHQQQLEWRWEQERRTYQSRLLLLSRLQTEVFYLSKSSQEIESAVARTFRLYQRLFTTHPEEAAECLNIARDFHEVKKDYQRIMKSLQQHLQTRHRENELRFSEIVGMVLAIGESYASSLGKSVVMQGDLRYDFPTRDYLRWLSILDNLVTNAVEALGPTGEVTVTSAAEGDVLVVTVRDTACGIPREDWELVFLPGYTTKSDPVSGQLSTGLGLTHVATLVRAMQGSVAVSHSSPEGTTLRLVFPLDAISPEAAPGEERTPDETLPVLADR